jgi:hypothetical protein
MNSDVTKFKFKEKKEGKSEFEFCSNHFMHDKKLALNQKSALKRQTLCN